MVLHIDLLGPPRAERDDRGPVRPRGRKSWALLAYLLLAERPPSRERLAALLFPEADDPLGAVRWNLSELRRALGPGFVARGDPVVVALPPGSRVDVAVLRAATAAAAVEVAIHGGALLEGVHVAGSAAFELWLADERRHLVGLAAAVLHEGAQAALAASDPARAVRLAAQLVALVPLDEASHVLLVTCLRAAGDQHAARDQAQRAAALLRRELDREPSVALLAAAAPPVVPVAGPPLPSVPALLEVAEAAIAAGAVSQGLRTLEEASAAARRDGDGELLARVLLVRGHALVHVGRGGDEEGGAVLHEAAALALGVGEPLLAAAARREQAFADLQRGRLVQSRRTAAAAARLAAGDDAELSWIEAIEGAAACDQGSYGGALPVLRSAVRRADRAGADQAAVFARSFLGRLHLLRGEGGDAVGVLQRAERDAAACWMAYTPWPQSLLAEALLRCGDVDGAEARLERALARGSQLDDPCLMSIATRGLGLVAVARGRIDQGYDLLVEAPSISRRLPDSYLWIEAHALDALCAVAVRHRPGAARGWVDQLEPLAARTGMRELQARALLHRARLGDEGALEAAQDLAEAVRNPALDEELEVVRGSAHVGSHARV